MEKLAGIFALIVLFVSISFIYPDLREGALNANATGGMALLLQNFPIIILAVVSGVFLALALEKRRQ